MVCIIHNACGQTYLYISTELYVKLPVLYIRIFTGTMHHLVK